MTTLRRHWAFAGLTAAGAVLRILIMVAYPRMFWIPDSGSYLYTAFNAAPSALRPGGYSIFLALFVQFGHTIIIMVIQHAIGLGIAIAGYVLLQRRGVSRLVSALAMTPLLFEGRTLTLEHYLLAETLFTALLMAAVIVLLWWDRPTGWQCAAVGLLFGCAAITRSVGLVVLALPVLYLLIRRVGWRPLAALMLAATLPLGGYLVWYHQTFGVYAFGGYSGRFLWARTTSFMDCGKLDLTAIEHKICPWQPLDRRWPPETYLWSQGSFRPLTTPDADAVHGALAIKAITRQPGDYLAIIVRDSVEVMLPGQPPHGGHCVVASWTLPDVGPAKVCGVALAPTRPRTRKAEGLAQDLQGPLIHPLSVYSDVTTLPGGVAALSLLFGLMMAIVRPWRARWRNRVDGLVLSTLALGMVVASVATASIDTRYTAPSLPFAMLGIALAVRTSRSGAGTPVGPPAQRTEIPTEQLGAPGLRPAPAGPGM